MKGGRNNEEGKAASPKAVPAADVKLLQAHPKRKRLYESWLN